MTSSKTINRVFWTGQIALVVALISTLLLLGGCCTYRGKAVSKRDAVRMRNLGMDVQCPGEHFWSAFLTGSSGLCERDRRYYEVNNNIKRRSK